MASDRGSGSTTQARIRDLYDNGRALAEHGADDHTEDVIPRVSSDPATGDLDGGEIWYRTDNDEYRGYEAGTGVVTFDTTAV